MTEITIDDRTVDTAAGPLRVRVYAPAAPAGPGLVWAHGGGFAAGDLDMPEADGVSRSLAERGIPVVSVDYRLAPTPASFAPDLPRRGGVHYPAASDDIVAAWAWTLDNADALGIDPARLAIGGASAGANLVTGAVLRMLHAGAGTLPGAAALPGGTPALPALAVLAYPTLHAVQPAPPAALRAKLDADPVADRFGAAIVRGMYENYLGSPVEQADVYAVPGLATTDQLAGFPPALMINGDVDELRVSGEAFAATLDAAGVPVDVSLEPGTQHGHLNRPEQPAYAASLARIAAHLLSLTPRPLTRPAAGTRDA